MHNAYRVSQHNMVVILAVGRSARMAYRRPVQLIKAAEGELETELF